MDSGPVRNMYSTLSNKSEKLHLIGFYCKNTHICCFPTATVVAWTHLSVMSYVHCLSCFLFSYICNVSKKRDKWPMHQVLCRQTAHVVVKVQYLPVFSQYRLLHFAVYWQVTRKACTWSLVQTFDLSTTAGSVSAVTDPYLPSCLNL
jgi:hypothetical protein